MREVCEQDGWFDKSLLEKVVFNLLSNAFKYTASGESVLMEVSEVTLKELDPKRTDGLYKDENSQYVILKVKDFDIFADISFTYLQVHATRLVLMQVHQLIDKKQKFLGVLINNG